MISVLLLASVAIQPPATPEAAVRAFYAAYHAKSFTGLPPAAELAGIKDYLSPTLLAALQAAGAKQARCLKAHPDDKPPWVEGDLFTSNFEGFTAFTPAAPTATGPKATVPVDFEYTENGKTFKWRDQVVVVRVGARWLVDDVRYRKAAGGFTSGFGAGLRASLSGAGC